VESRINSSRQAPRAVKAQKRSMVSAFPVCESELCALQNDVALRRRCSCRRRIRDLPPLQLCGRTGLSSRKRGATGHRVSPLATKERAKKGSTAASKHSEVRHGTFRTSEASAATSAGVAADDKCARSISANAQNAHFYVRCPNWSRFKPCETTRLPAMLVSAWWLRTSSFAAYAFPHSEASS
jgi:hypothetical protein